MESHRPDNNTRYMPPQQGQPQYGQPQYGQPQYGQPQYGQPPMFGQRQMESSPHKQIGILMFVVVVAYIGLTLIFAGLIEKASPIMTIVYSTIIVTVCGILVPSLVHIFKGRGLKESYNLNKLPANQIIPCILIGVGLCFAALVLANILDGIYVFFGADTSGSQAPMPNLTQPVNFILIVLCVCIAPAVCEELLCRSVVLYSLRSLGMHKAALISGLYFALLHMSYVTLPMYLLLGYIFGIIAYKTRSVLSTMIIHFVYNFTIILLQMLADGSANTEDVAYGIESFRFWSGLIVFAIIGVIFLVPAIIWFKKNCIVNDIEESGMRGMTSVAFTDDYNALLKPHHSFGVGFIIAAIGILFLFTGAVALSLAVGF